MRLPLFLALFLIACNEVASPKDLDTDPLEHKMRETGPGEQRIDVVGDADGNILVRYQPYGEGPTWADPLAVSYAGQSVYVSLDEDEAHGELFWMVRDESTGWEASNFAAPTGWESGIESPSAQPEATGQGWVVVCPLGATVSFEPM